MATAEIVYYTCLNNDCPKHRNVFIDGDPQHEGCARERLWLEGRRRGVPVWLWLAGAGLAVTAVVGTVMRAARKRQSRPPMLQGEMELKTWSGAQAHRDDREGSTAPPPIRMD